MKLLIGGSPCTHWSIAQTKNRETEPSGIGWELFKNYLVALEKYKPDFFLYENNKSMSAAIREQITKELGVEPIEINSALVSAQSRKRLYWTNIPGVGQPEDKGILLRDILETGVVWREKAYTLRASIGVHGGHSSVLKTIMEPGKFSFNGVAEPVRIGTIESDAKNADFDSQQYRVYSPDGKSVTVCAQGGGVGAKTGLYATPIRVGDMPNSDGIIKGGQAHRIYDADGKAATLTARPNGGGVDGPLYAVPAGMAWRGRGDSSSYEMRDDQKANAAKCWAKTPEVIIQAAERLRGVQIENRPAVELIRRFNYQNVLIYADPPYMLGTRQNRKQYRHEMTDDDHMELLEAIKAHRGPAIISGYDSDLYNRELKGWYKDGRTSFTQTASKRREILWMNFEPAAQMDMFREE